MESTPFSPEQERWAEISDFPGYAVSDSGRVMRLDTQNILTRIPKSSGMHMVGLMRDNTQYKRSLPLLVAKAFIAEPPYPEFDTPIHLDGDRANHHYTNLVWRPNWFARRYHKQFIDGHTTFENKIEDMNTGVVYQDSMTAAMYHGLLDVDIIVGMHNNIYVWPTRQFFREAI